jgi:hypothetical protein
MEHLKALLSTPSTGRAPPTTLADRTQRLRATLSSVARSIKSNFVDTLARKAKKRATTQSPLTPPPLKRRRRATVTPPTTTLWSPSQLSTVSSLTQGSQEGCDTNQFLQDVLYGDNQSSSTTYIRPTLSTSNLGLRRLLIADILQLQEKDQLIVVLSPTSRLLPIYKGFIQHQVRQTNRHLSQPSRLEVADELLLKRHEFQRLGSSYYEFRVVVRAYPKRHLLYDDAIDAASWGLWLAQGEGFSVELLDYPGQTTAVKFKDLQDAVSMEIWRVASRHNPLPTILFGFPHLMESKVVALDNALDSVSGDLLLTLNVLLEYYKSESCMYRHRASDLIANATKASTLQADTYVDELRLEIQSSALELFVFEVDQLYKLAIQQHYNSFHFVNEPLIPVATKDLLYNKMCTRFPMHSAVLESICTTERNLRANNPPAVAKKKNTILFHFLTLCWQRNKDYLVHWSMMETLAYEAKGIPAMATSLAVERRYATSANHAFAVLDDFSDQGANTLAAAIAAEVTLNAGIDNYNWS